MPHTENCCNRLKNHSPNQKLVSLGSKIAVNVGFLGGFVKEGCCVVLPGSGKDVATEFYR